MEEFSQSEAFKNFETIPISPLRVRSYIHNPAAMNNDVVLCMGFDGEKLVAFRTFFAGQVNCASAPIRFGWCSGNWVHPAYRRKGLSEKLLAKAWTDWDGKLMSTNYAPNSEKLFLKTGLFQPIYQFYGFRGYLFPNTKKMFGGPEANFFIKAGTSIIDSILHCFSNLRAQFYTFKPSPGIRFEIAEKPDTTCMQRVETHKNSLFFVRGEKELHWIFNFPWMTNLKEDHIANYPFSTYSSDFHYKTVKIFNKERFEGFFLFSVKNGHLKTLFIDTVPGLEKDISGFIKNYALKNRIEMVTIYNFELAKYCLNQKFPFLPGKAYGQKIYSSFKIEEHTNYRFQDGDGDLIFT